MPCIMTVVELRVAKWGGEGGGAVLILKTSITPCLILTLHDAPALILVQSTFIFDTANPIECVTLSADVQ